VLPLFATMATPFPATRTAPNDNRDGESLNPNACPTGQQRAFSRQG
jgi:hypothetical protein